MIQINAVLKFLNYKKSLSFVIFQIYILYKKKSKLQGRIKEISQL